MIGLLDITSLNGDDTEESIRRMVATARSVYESHGVAPAAICVYPAFIGAVRDESAGIPTKVAAVAAGFPHGLSPFATRTAEVALCVDMGAEEIDVVIRRSLALEGRWDELEEELREFRAAAGTASLKVILEVAELKSLDTVTRAAAVAVAAGADFIKTSTGKAASPATLDEGRAALKAIGPTRVGFKTAGGIKTPEQARAWAALAADCLGSEALTSRRFRIGASSLFDVLVQSLGSHPAPGGYADPLGNEDLHF